MPISPTLHAELEKRLLQSRSDLTDQVRGRTDSSPGDPPPIGPSAHMVQGDDAPEAEMTGDDEARLASREDGRLQEINAALGRLASGGIGICVSCGAEIPEARLLAEPWAQTCIACQTRIESEGHSRPGPTM